MFVLSRSIRPSVTHELKPCKLLPVRARTHLMPCIRSCFYTYPVTRKFERLRVGWPIQCSISSKGSHPFHFVKLVAWLYCSLFMVLSCSPYKSGSEYQISWDVAICRICGGERVGGVDKGGGLDASLVWLLSLLSSIWHSGYNFSAILFMDCCG